MKQTKPSLASLINGGVQKILKADHLKLSTLEKIKNTKKSKASEAWGWEPTQQIYTRRIPERKGKGQGIVRNDRKFPKFDAKHLSLNLNSPMKPRQDKLIDLSYHEKTFKR